MANIGWFDPEIDTAQYFDLETLSSAWFDSEHFPEDAVAGTPIIGSGGLHHIWCGIGDPGVSVVPQTLHTIEQGISA